MIETVDAEVFVRAVRGDHATEPYILGCRDASGQLVDVFTKISWLGCPIRGLVSEIICNLLAADLGLSVPKPVLVALEDDFVQALRAIQPMTACRFEASAKPAFGTKRVGNGYSDAQSCPLEVPPLLLAEIWAFDRLVLNCDRRITKPNCLTNGSDICLIDHEKALNCDFLGGMLNPYPWADGVIQATDGRSPHVFRTHIQGYVGTLGRLKQAWLGVDNVRIDEYAAALPAGWHVASKEIADATSYLKLLRTHLDEAFEQLTGALT